MSLLYGWKHFTNAIVKLIHWKSQLNWWWNTKFGDQNSTKTNNLGYDQHIFKYIEVCISGPELPPVVGSQKGEQLKLEKI